MKFDLLFKNFNIGCYLVMAADRERLVFWQLLLQSDLQIPHFCWFQIRLCIHRGVFPYQSNHMHLYVYTWIKIDLVNLIITFDLGYMS